MTSCDPTCLTCSGNATTCTQCVSISDTPFLLDYTCLGSCPASFFLNLEERACFPCNEACKTCYGFNNDECLSCNQGFYFASGKCVS